MKPLSYSTLGFEDRPIELALEAIASAGFRQVELLVHGPHLGAAPSGAALASLRRRLETCGFTGRTVHAPLERNVLGAPDEAWRREAVARLAGYVHLAGAIQASGIVIHPVPNPSLITRPDDPELSMHVADAVRRSLDHLAPIAGQAGVRILLENLPYRCHLPYLTMADLRPLVDDYPPEQVGLVIDVGHAGTLRRDPAQETYIAGNRLGGTHLHDVDGDNPDDQHWPPTMGSLDWATIRAALAEVGYAGAWTFEVACARYGETQEELARLTYRIAAAW
jgi:L-ribulose-5-phosphate 3-epimerase